MLVPGTGLVIGLATLAAIADSADRSAATGLTTELLGRAITAGPVNIHVNGITIESSKPLEVLVARITFAPGGTTGWHSHPGAVFVVVDRGTLTRYPAGDSTAQTFTGGQAFAEHDPSGENMIRNEGSVAAEVIVAYLAPPATAHAETPLQRRDP